MIKRILACSCRGTRSLGAGDRPVAIAVPKPAMRGQSGHITVRSEDRSIDRHRRPPEQPATCAAEPQTQCGQGLVFYAGSGLRMGAQGPELGAGFCWRWAICARARKIVSLQGRSSAHLRAHLSGIDPSRMADGYDLVADLPLLESHPIQPQPRNLRTRQPEGSVIQPNCHGRSGVRGRARRLGLIAQGAGGFPR